MTAIAYPKEPRLNLLDSPWVPVYRKNGKTERVSLKTLFREADEILGIAEPTPPNCIALYRLLLAILHRALTTQHGRWGTKERVHWYNNGLPLNKIEAYLESWRDRFWLVHPTQPFMQVAVLFEHYKKTGKGLKPLAQIKLSSSSGNNAVLFDHSFEGKSLAENWEQALCDLLGYLQFVPGGLVRIIRGSDKAGPLTNSAAFLLQSEKLSKTLLLNLHPWSDHEDLPSWEKPPVTINNIKSEPTLATGPNDRYTRLTRSVIFLATDDEQVDQLLFAEGVALEEDEQQPDPMHTRRVTKDGKLIRIRFEEGRAIWRELPVLAPYGEHDTAPRVFEWGNTLLQSVKSDEKDLPVLVAGLASNQAKLERWRLEYFKIPSHILTSPDVSQAVRLTIQEAESFFREISSLFITMISESLPDPNHPDTRNAARNRFNRSPATAAYFNACERQLGAMMRAYASNDPDHANTLWNLAQLDGARAAWKAVVSLLGDSPSAIRSVARYQSLFEMKLRKNQVTKDQSEDLKHA